MPAVLRDLLRSLPPLLHDRRARLALSIGGAVLYVVGALPAVLPGDGESSRAGALAVVAAVLVAVAIGFSILRPALALVLVVPAIAGAVVAGARDIGAVWPVAPFLAVLVPVLVASFDVRSWVRTFALGVSAVTAGAVIAWGYAFYGTYGARPALVVSALLVSSAPVGIAAIWRRPPLRDRLVQAVRERVGAVADLPTAPSTVVWVAAGLYLACVVADLLTGTLASIVTAGPLAAALIWWRVRPDFALGLAAIGLGLTAIISPLDSVFGLGEAAAVYSAVVPLFGALIGDSVRSRRFAYGLIALAALLSSLVAGSLAIGLVALVIGAAVVGAAWAWRQRTTTGVLRLRLRESERRGKVAERGVQVEQERNRIAREVHDVVAHSLAVVIAQADGARFAAEAKPTSVAPALEAIADTARTALGEVRTMLHDLRSFGGDGVVPGPDDIDAVLETVRSLGIDVQRVSFGRPRQLTEDAGLAMFRIAQEAMTNALRHGDRTQPITVEIDWGEQAVVLAVSNGTLDAPSAATERLGHGIPGMIERAGLVGGECTAGAGSNGRFRVRASLPVLPAADPATEDHVSDALTKLFAAASRAS